MHLHASVEHQMRAHGAGPQPPLVAKPNQDRILRDLMALRDPLYREIADVVVENRRRSRRAWWSRILERLRKLPPR